MKKLSSVFICLFVLFASAAFAQKVISKQTKPKTSVNKKVKNSKQNKQSNYVCQLPVSVIDVELDRTFITLNCPKSDESCSSEKIIKVKTLAVDIEEMKYVYTASGGKIIGEGASVEWDLSDVKAGNYIITAAISQPIFNGTRWEVLGMTKTRVITVKE